MLCSAAGPFSSSGAAVPLRLAEMHLYTGVSFLQDPQTNCGVPFSTTTTRGPPKKERERPQHAVCMWDASKHIQRMDGQHVHVAPTVFERAFRKFGRPGFGFPLLVLLTPTNQSFCRRFRCQESVGAARNWEKSLAGDTASKKRTG